ncbi:RCC1 domain-containing protein 1-like [Galendromus occidentalis]|uniref:RCC1 domain-containing protein 1-like n=1 Tax=Galendromus occidentalis TaxID=34638 RepID=A0AAJ7SGJ2_9ACAR|nr:RCC1 domain-containing protein 1-like [Galendromus occidentalis]
MWKTSGYPLNISSIAADDIFIGWKDFLAVSNNKVSNLRTGKVVSDDTAAVDDCSLSRDHFAIVRRGKCRIHGLYDGFEHEIENLDGVLQISMMAQDRLALRTATHVLIYDYKNCTSKSWELRCSRIAAGLGHLVALSTEGKVFVYGDGSRGQRGSGDLSADEELRPLAHLEDLDITHVSAGGWHSAAISDRGYLYQWGWNQHGQCGGPRGDSRNVVGLPELRDVGIRLRDVRCGSRHTVVLTDDGRLLSWGWDDFGQCSKIDRTCCSGSSKGKTLEAGFWTTAYKLCEVCRGS